MTGVERQAEALGFLEKFEELLAPLGVGNANGMLHYIRNCVNVVHSDLAPFEVGDRAALSFTPNLSRPGHGWRGAKHFLVAGHPGTVRDVTITSRGHYSIGFEPDDQTWIPSDGPDREPRPVTTPAVYYFRADELHRLAEDGRLMAARVLELSLDKHVATFYGPSERAKVEVWELENNEYRVMMTRPFPAPTRGDKVTTTDSRVLEDALTLAAAWRWHLWHEGTSNDAF